MNIIQWCSDRSDIKRSRRKRFFSAKSARREIRDITWTSATHKIVKEERGEIVPVEDETPSLSTMKRKTCDNQKDAHCGRDEIPPSRKEERGEKKRDRQNRNDTQDDDNDDRESNSLSQIQEELKFSHPTHIRRGEGRKNNHPLPSGPLRSLRHQLSSDDTRESCEIRRRMMWCENKKGPFSHSSFSHLTSRQEKKQQESQNFKRRNVHLRTLQYLRNMWQSFSVFRALILTNPQRWTNSTLSLKHSFPMSSPFLTLGSTSRQLRGSTSRSMKRECPSTRKSSVRRTCR